MSLSFEGGKNRGEVGMKTSQRAAILMPMVNNFVTGFLRPLCDSDHSFSVDLDMEATEITDDFVTLKDWTIQLGDTDLNDNQYFIARVVKRMRDAGYEVFGSLQQGFDVKIPRKAFEDVATGADAIASRISGIREQISA